MLRLPRVRKLPAIFEERFRGQFRRLTATYDLPDDIWSEEGETNYPAHVTFAYLLSLSMNFISIPRLRICMEISRVSLR